MSNLYVFGSRLKELREDSRMTIKELADSIGLSEATVSRYERGAEHNSENVVGAT